MQIASETRGTRGAAHFFTTGFFGAGGLSGARIVADDGAIMMGATSFRFDPPNRMLYRIPSGKRSFGWRR